jgi:hypothetical protein
MLSGRADDARHLLAARPTRWLLLCGSLAAGLALAFATYHLSAKFGGSHSLIPLNQVPGQLSSGHSAWPRPRTLGCGASGGGVRPE